MPVTFLGCAGAETSDISELFASSGTVTANSGTQRTGNYCFKISPSGSATIRFDAAFYQFTRVAFKISAQASNAALFLIQSVTPTTLVTVGISAAFKLTVQAAGGTLQTGTTILGAGTWYVLEIKHDNSGGSPNVIGEIRLNGFVEATSNNGTDVTSSYQCVASGFAATYDLYLDDIVNVTAYPGIGQVDCIRPNGAGDDSADWTNTYAALAEAPTVDGTTHERVKAGSGATYFAHALSTVASVGTINFVRMVTRYQRGSGAGTTHQARSKQGATTEDFTISATTAYVNYFNTLVTTLPTTQTLLDSLQAGVNHSGAQDSYVSEVWVMVDHAPYYDAWKQQQEIPVREKLEIVTY